MSVAATHESISTRPGSMGVTSPTSGKEMQEDVARKMKLWGVVEAFRDG